MYNNVYSSAIHNSLKLETTQMSTTGGKDKGMVVYAYKGVLCIHAGGQTMAIPNNVNESHKTLTSIRSQTQKCVKYDSVYVKFKARQSSCRV